MKSPDTPLTEAELDQLDQFLMNRLDEDVETDDRDPGIFDISSLDGFFTAVVSSPVAIMPSEWLPALWGDFENEWESTQEFEEIFQLLMRHMNGIVGTLMGDSENFEPLFYERTVRGKQYLVVDEWCEGYCRGMSLAEEAWASGGDEMEMLLAPIVAFASVSDWAGHEYEDEEIRRLQSAVTPCVIKIHEFWLSRREQFMTSSIPFRHSAPKVGRNDPCPCGSGKKFKHCCLH